MNVLVDTSVWSLALRRAKPAPSPIARELAELVREGRVVMIGPIRQELLSGLREHRQFQLLRDHLRAFLDVDAEPEDFEEAALFFNRCRAQGIQGSNTDFLMCAMASRRGLAIFTTDGDFREYARVLSLRFHQPRR